MLSKLREDANGEIIAVIHAAGVLMAYASGLVTAGQASTRLTEVLRQTTGHAAATFSAADNTDIANIRARIDALPTVDAKIIYITKFMAWGAMYNVGNDAILSQAELRALLNIA